jgi:hypothetical protein
MTKKSTRDRVVAEITPFHLMRLASEHGCSVSREQAIAFLNQESAQEMWKHMMQAGLDFIACTLLGHIPAPQGSTSSSRMLTPLQTHASLASSSESRQQSYANTCGDWIAAVATSQTP